MGRITIILLVSLALGILGCGNGEDVMAPPQDEPGFIAPGSAAKGGPEDAGISHGPVVESLTGSGHLAVGEAWRTFSFTAHRYEDGSVEGRFQGRNHETDLHVKGTVLCFTIVENTGYVAAIVEQSTNPALVGLAVVFKVQDNGEGKNDPPDKISQLFLGGQFPENFCLNPSPFFPPLLDIDAGNVQVK